MSIVIKPASRNDIDLLCHLGAVTFAETFAAFNSEEDMKLFIATNYNPVKLLEEFEQPDSSFYIVYVDEVPAGFAKTRTSEKPEELKGKKHIELERLYVLQKFQKQKLGLLLITNCINKAIEQGYEVFWLGVWEHNGKALNFYSKLGFTKFGEHIFMLGTDAQTDHLMQLDLVKYASISL